MGRFSSTMAERVKFIKENYEELKKLGAHGTFELMVKKGFYKMHSRRDVVHTIHKVFDEIKSQQTKSS